MIPPKTHPFSKFGSINSVFLTLRLRIFFRDQTLHLFCNFVATRPSLSTSESRFKIQDPGKPS